MTALLVAAAAALAVAERVPAAAHRVAPLRRPGAGTDLVYLLTGYVLGAAAASAWVRTASGWTGLGSRLWPSVPFAVQVVAALVLLDLGNFLVHRALHRADWLWRFHEAHHSSLRLEWLATFRSHLVEQLLRRAVAPLGLIVLGVPADAVGIAATAFLGWAMLNHANLRLPPGVHERVLITPRLHRVHHVPATTERNFGTVFVWWDALGGTLVRSDPNPAAPFGLPRRHLEYPQGWARQLVAPFARRERRPAGDAGQVAGSTTRATAT